MGARTRGRITFAFAAESRVWVCYLLCYSAWETETSTSGRRALSGWSGCAAASRPGTAGKEPADDVVSLPQRAWLVFGWSRVALTVLCVLWLIINHASRGRIPQLSLAGRSLLETFVPTQGGARSGAFSGARSAAQCGRGGGGHMIKRRKAPSWRSLTHSGSQLAETQGCRWRSSGTMQFFSIKRRSALAHSLTRPLQNADEPPCCPAALPPAWLPWPSEFGAADGPPRAGPCHWPGPDAL